MPKECLPVEGKPRGRLSYTITSSSGAKVEVLLKAKAFRIIKMAVFSRTGHLLFKQDKSFQLKIQLQFSIPLTDNQNL